MPLVQLFQLYLLAPRVISAVALHLSYVRFIALSGTIIITGMHDVYGITHIYIM